MRKAYFSVEWLANDAGEFLGLNLGYDRCAEHEWGIEELRARLNADLPEFPAGIDDYRIREVPEDLRLMVYDAYSKDKRRKRPYKAALLAFVSDSKALQPAELACALGRRAELDFWPDHPSDPKNEPRYDLNTAWSGSEFAIHVRGEDNIAKLTALFEAMRRGDVAIAGASSVRAFDRTGLNLVVVSAVSQEQRDEVAHRHAEYRELELAMRACGIREQLQAAGKTWYSMKPVKFDEETGQLVVRLNPCRQDKYSSGCFTLDDLLDWVEEKGPVVKDPALQAP